MAENLPQYTWSASVLTTKGVKKVVYSTVTGKVVGEIRNGKFVQTVDKIPQPTKKKPRTVTVPETARAGGIENAVASYERDAAYYKSVAEDVDSTPAERAKARDQYNQAQGEIAKLKGQQQEFESAQKEKTAGKETANARQTFESLKKEYQSLQEQFDLLIDKTNDPKANRIRTRMNEIVNESLDVWGAASGKETNVPEVTALLKGETPKAAAVSNAPTGTTTPLTSREAVTAATTSGPVGSNKPAGTTTGGTKTSTAGTRGTTTTAPFSAGTFRMADEASMGNLPSGPNVPGAKSNLEQILGNVQNYFDLPDYIFKMDKELGDLLVRAVNEKWTGTRWINEFKLTNWYRKNNENVRQRLTTFGNYKDLQGQGQDVSKSDYGLWLSKKRRALKVDARNIAGIELTDQQADEIAQKIYLGFLDDDENAIREFLVPYISKVDTIVGGQKISGFGGQALKDYQTLQSIAKANGFSLAQILPGVSTSTTGGNLEEAVLEQLALGKLDINRISQDARMMAAMGQPESVRNLLNQGYDLDQIYAPYRNTMATTLELNPEQIDLNDPTLRMAISDKGETNLYDFQRALRKDSRWQYTQQARQEVGDITLSVLRDFGFQG